MEGPLVSLSLKVWGDILPLWHILCCWPCIESKLILLSHKDPCSAGSLNNWQSLQKWHQYIYNLSKGLFDISNVWIPWRPWTSKLIWKTSLERKSLRFLFQLFLSYQKKLCPWNHALVFLKEVSPYSIISLEACALKDQVLCGVNIRMLKLKKSPTL